MVSDRQSRSLPVIFCLALFLLPHGVYSFLFQTPPGNDFDSQLRLILRFHYYWRAGFFPLWSVMWHGGMPAGYEAATSGIFSPVNWIYGFFPQIYQGRLLGLLIHSKLFVLGTGGVGAFLFLRTVCRSDWASLFGAVT